MRRGRERWGSGASVLLAVAGVTLLAAACGGGSSPGVASLGTTTTTTAAPASGAGLSAAGLSAAFDKYASCMRSHGEPGFQDPIVSSNGNTTSVKMTVGPGVAKGSPQFRTASAACSHFLPRGGHPGGPGIALAQQVDYLKAAACMRAHGITGFPDPSFANGGVFPVPHGMNTNAPQFVAARATCQKLIPAGLPYSG